MVNKWCFFTLLESRKLPSALLQVLRISTMLVACRFVDGAGYVSDLISRMLHPRPLNPDGVDVFSMWMTYLTHPGVQYVIEDDRAALLAMLELECKVISLVTGIITSVQSAPYISIYPYPPFEVTASVPTTY